MKIRAKLLAVSGGSLLLLAAAAALYLAIMSPLERIDAELAILDGIAAKAAALSSAVGRMTSGPLEARAADYRAAAAAYQESLAGFGRITYLPTLNETIFTALESLKEFENMTFLDRLDTQLDQMIEALKGAYGDSGSQISAMKLVATLTERGDAQRNLPVTFATTTAGTSDMMALITGTIATQRAAIGSETAAIRSQALAGVTAAIVAMFLLVTIASAFVSASITKPVRRLQAQFDAVAAGDLTVRPDTRSKDEIGAISRHFAGLLDTLETSLGRIQESARRNLEAKDQLSHAVVQASSSATEIEANALSIKTQLQTLDGQIASGTASLSTVDSAFSGFTDGLQEQRRSIDAARDAVGRMGEAVDGIAQIAEDDLHAVNFLVENAQRGAELIDQAFAKVGEIAEQIDTIQEMAEVISHVAEKTNILALNAAIEAAHAGELGKGFAIVADEIGKLAITTADSSSDITKKIVAIVATIRDAAASKEEATLTYSQIGAESKAVADSFTGIHTGVVDLQRESRTIVDSMDRLQEHSRSVEGQSARIARDTADLARGFAAAERVSHELSSNIGEITIGLHEIGSTIQLVADQARRLEDCGRELEETAGCFRTGSGGGCADPDEPLNQA